MTFNKEELLTVYSGLELLWKSQVNHANSHKAVPKKYKYLKDRAAKTDVLRGTISNLLKETHE